MIIQMSATHKSHPSDNDIELYALGRLSDEVAAPIEEHLLVCDSCRDRVKQADEFVTTICAALRDDEAAETKRSSSMARFFSVPVPIWVGALAAVALIAVVVPQRQKTMEPFAVQLESYRGAGIPFSATAPAGQPLLLHVDVKGLPERPAYQVEIADAKGAVIWNSPVQAKGEAINVTVDRSLRAGQYWARIYQNDASRDLLREFALELR